MEEADIDPVMAIAASLPTAPHWTRSAYEAAISSLGEPKRMAWVAVHSGEVIGFAIVRLLAPESELESIAIQASAQGRGFGSSLLSTIVQELKVARPETGVEQVDLEVRASNEAALGLYRQAGFRDIGRRRGYYADPIEDAVLLRLDLAK
jgi:[ribosomal protein S18]-alanine N-acetyltransferase